jgi:hypothetical protein
MTIAFKSEKRWSWVEGGEVEMGRWRFPLKKARLMGCQLNIDGLAV